MNLAAERALEKCFLKTVSVLCLCFSGDTHDCMRVLTFSKGDCNSQFGHFEGGELLTPATTATAAAGPDAQNCL